MKRIKIKTLFASKNEFSEKEVLLCGWIRSNRSQAQFGFLNVNDGSYFESVQIVYEAKLSNFEEISKYRVGMSVKIKGIVKLTPELKQPLELHAVEVEMLGDCPENYPIQPKRHTREFLREVAHLRPRTNLFSAVFRIRSVAAYAIHSYFQERGYVYVHTPLITCADCEGSDQMFKITTLDFDNIEKSYSDAFTGNVWIDDIIVVDATIRKYYSVLPRVEIDLKYANQLCNRHQYKSMINRKDFTDGMNVNYFGGK